MGLSFLDNDDFVDRCTEGRVAKVNAAPLEDETEITVGK